MHQYRLTVLLGFIVCFCSLAQDEFDRPPLSSEERAARRAQFMQMMQNRMGGGVSPDRDAAVATQRPAEGGELETARKPAPDASQTAVNWENVTLKDCIEVLCRDLGMEFVISPSVNVSQEVSVRAGDVTNWSKADKEELFDAILETAGVQRVQRGRVWVFSPSDIRPVVEAFTDEKYGDGKPVIGVIKLKSIDASQAEQFLNTVGGKPARVFAMKGSRMILVLGTQQFLNQMEELVKMIDFPAGLVCPFPLEYASSDDIAKELASIFNGRTGGDGDAIRFISVTRLNMVVAHNVPEGMMDEVTHWVALLDRFDDTNDRVTRVYRLQVIDADTIGKTLDSLYSTLYKQTQTKSKQTSTTAAAKKNTSASNAAAKNNGKPAAKSQPSSVSKASSSSSPSSPDMEEEAVILSDKDTNTLIINATPDQHRDIDRTIKELDRPRRQVLVETVLVEVTLDKGLNFGVEWALSQGISVQGNVAQSFNRNNIADNNDGFSYLLQSSSDKLAFIQAAENDDRLHVLSSPTVLTRDGMEAEVSFGKEVPIQEKSTSGTSSTRDTYSYNYMDAKMTLTVTPVIDDNKMVTLNITQVLRQIPTDYE
ncbi:MAG: secretin N-terminal domain-containing protein, partial [Kiritimatiellales bacterium]